MEITKAKRSEYEEIQYFLEDVFGHSFGTFRRGWPQVWLEDYTCFDNTIMAREEGRIAALVRVFPLNFVQGGVKIKAAGIGSVSTSYSQRGKGYMSELLKESFRMMVKEKCPVSVLWGDRHRYGYFGYENCGSLVDLNINERGMKKNGIKSVDAKRFFPEDDVLGSIIEIYNRNSYRKERTLDEFKTAYCRRGSAVYYCVNGGEFAYAVVSSMEIPGKRLVREYGGDGETLLGILKHLAERFGIPDFILPCPDLRSVPAIVLDSSSGWTVRSNCMLKIINLEDTLKAFSVQPDFNFPRDEEITFTIEGESPVTLSKPGKEVVVERRKSSKEIVLDERSMTRMLFGTSFWAPESVDSETLGLLKMFLPINIFIWDIDTV